MSPEWKKRRIIIRKRRRKRGVDRSIPFLREEIRRAANLKSKKSCCGFVPINILRLLGADATKHRNQSTFDTAQLSFVPLLAQLKVPIDNIAPVVCFLLSYVFFFFLPLFALDHRWGGGIESRVSLWHGCGPYSCLRWYLFSSSYQPMANVAHCSSVKRERKDNWTLESNISLQTSSGRGGVGFSNNKKHVDQS